MTPVADPSRLGVVPTEEDGRVTAFIEKPPAGTAPTNLINAGIYVLETAVLDRIPAGSRVLDRTGDLPGLVAERVLYALASDAYWLDTGHPAAVTSRLSSTFSAARRAHLESGRSGDPARRVA